MWRVGVDTGGTFTDLVAIGEHGTRKSAKVPSTPPDFEAGIFDGLERLGIDPADVSLIVHGTTITTNAVVTKSGAKTALLTTKGFRDVLEIRRANREDLYDILWDPPAPLVPRFNRLEVTERVNYAGEVLTSVDEEEVRRLADVLRKRGVESVAICFLHSYMNPVNELAVRDVLREEMPGCYITASAEILPEPPEFERTATVTANAYLGPILDNYVGRLESGLRARGYAADFLLMHSAGGVMMLESARQLPVRTAGSGPAAGVVGAAAIGAAAGRSKVISLDMGGTSCDVSVILDARPKLTMQYQLEWGVPIQFPSVDFVAIGAGGGSIAWIDNAGYPRSGPESAGARPGPACYGGEGDRPTTTDANLVLRRLNETTFLGGQLSVDRGLAEAAVRREVAEPLGLSVEDAAAGIIRIANGNMASAVRLVTIQKGFDPREFSLVAFGGAGPLHAVEVARELGIPEVIVPPEPGLTSAFGLLFVDLVHDMSQAFVMGQNEDRFSEAEHVFTTFETELARRLEAEGAEPHEMALSRYIDVRYVGQLHTITVGVGERPFSDGAVERCIDGFHEAHEREYRYCRRDWPVEISVLRAEGRAAIPRPSLNSFGAVRDTGATRREVYFEGAGWLTTEVFDRGGLGPDAQLRGPAIVEEYDSTICIPAGASARVDGNGNLVISVDGEA
jgi:N-methylhydantoinase A